MSIHVCVHVYLYVDIDECSSNDTNDCNQLCDNTIGSYNCYCNDGYELALDYVTCVGRLHQHV